MSKNNSLFGGKLPFTTDCISPGLEEFENKIETGDEEEEESWLGAVVRQISRDNQELTEELADEEEAEKDGEEHVEPIALDPRLGGGEEGKVWLRRKRVAEVGRSCSLEVWRCIGEALEEGARCLDRPGGVMG